MSITRIAKGIVKGKVSGATVTLSSVSVTEGQGLIVCALGQGTSIPTIDVGTRTMNKVIQHIDNTGTFNILIHYIRALKNTGTRDIVATWSAAINAKVMAVIATSEPIFIKPSEAETIELNSPQIQSIWQILGLDPNAPMEVDDDGNVRTAGDIIQDVITVGNKTTVTRR